MTNIGDVIRQIETVKCDRHYPPTPEEQEIFNRILHHVYTGTVEFKGTTFDLADDISALILILERIPLLILAGGVLLISMLVSD